MPKSRKRRKLSRVFGTILLIYIILMGMFHLFQEKLIFLPTVLDQNHQYEFETNFEELYLTANDGAKLNALYFKANNPKGLIVYFHGNAGNLTRWGEITEFLAKKEWNVLVMDYRTYGKSTGNLSEEALYADAQQFYDYGKQFFTEDKIIIYGRSLGCAMASHTASNNDPQQLILETPFYNLEAIAQKRFPIFPVKTVLKYRFPNNENLGKVDCPITIFHGTEDSVVPYESGKQLYESISGNHAQLITIMGGEHNNLVEFEQYHVEIDKLLLFEKAGGEVAVPTVTDN